MSSITSVIKQLQSELPEGVQLVAVSKYHSIENIQEAYDAGQRIFGESHEQELRIKVPALPHDIKWHFIGHLQTNKVKYIAPYISLIHSVDSLHLLKEIDKQGRAHNRTIDCLLQLHVAKEETKFGLTLDECRGLLQSGEWRSMEGAQIVGLMCMASNTDDTERIVADFATADTFFQEVKQTWFAQADSFKIRSWGMSDDYPIAISHGASLIRIGSKIFGERNYI